MSEPAELAELVAYLVPTSRLSPSEAVHLVDEPFLLDERTRGIRLSATSRIASRGRHETEIFARLEAELARWGFALRNTASDKSAG
jgi:hypothetical protein